FDHAATLELVKRGLALDPAGEDRGVLKSVAGEVLGYVYDFPAGWAATTEALALLPAGHVRHTQSLATILYTGLLLGKRDEAEKHTETLLCIEPLDDRRGEYVTALGWASISHTARAERQSASRVLSRMAAIEAEVDERDAFVHGTARYWRARFAEL